MKIQVMKKDLRQIARENFQKWNNALQTKNAEQVALLYSQDSTFHPTMNGEFKIGKKGAEQYFEHFVQKNPFGKVVKDKVQAIGKDCFIHSGMYNFEMGPKDKREVAEARFTFVWQKEGKEWKIVHHHSSVIPK